MMTKINKETDDSKDYENVLYDGKQPQVIFIFFFRFQLKYFNSCFSSDVP